jgi:hypothetical protein
MKFFTIQTTMANQTELNATEMRLIVEIDKFIIYMLTENDKEKIIYSKLNELDGKELEKWVLRHLKPYLTSEYDYTEGDIEIENQNIINWLNEDNSDIFTNCMELLNIQKTLIDFDMDKGMNWFYGECMVRIAYEEDLLQYYCYMYIYEMDATYLKEYIINLLDPVEPK